MEKCGLRPAIDNNTHEVLHTDSEAAKIIYLSIREKLRYFDIDFYFIDD